LKRDFLSTIGRPLPGRETIVFSRNPEFQVEGCRVVTDLRAGIAAASGDELSR